MGQGSATPVARTATWSIMLFEKQMGGWVPPGGGGGEGAPVESAASVGMLRHILGTTVHLAPIAGNGSGPSVTMSPSVLESAVSASGEIVQR